jgi:hypothetical protein
MFRVLAAPSAKAGAIELSVTAAASALAVKNFAFNSSLLWAPPGRCQVSYYHNEAPRRRGSVGGEANGLARDQHQR